MQVIYGHFLQLEKRLSSFLKEIQSSPLERVLFITPSSVMSAHLKKRLTLDLGSTANLFFTKLSAVYRRIDGPSGKPVLSSYELQDFILKQVLAKYFGRNTARALYVSYKETLRDMADSLIDPAQIREHAAEGAFGDKEETAYMLNLLDIYEEYTAALNAVPGFRSYAAFYDSAAEKIPSSEYLASFKHIVFYGFYDLTARQLDMIRRIKENFPCTVFFPYKNIPAYSFAKKFFESNVVGMSSKTEELEGYGAQVLGENEKTLFDPAAQAEKADAALAIYSAQNAEGEVFAACKTILQLTEKEGFEFKDILLTARSLDPYKDILEAEMRKNKIPFSFVLERGTYTHPLAAFCQNMLGMSFYNFQREAVLSAVSSPYFAVKNNWRAVIEKSAVERDYAQWPMLIGPGLKDTEKPQAAALLKFLEELKRESDALGAPGPWAGKSARAVTMLKKFTDISVFNAKEKKIFDSVILLLESFASFESVRKDAFENEFFQDFYSALKNMTYNTAKDQEAGVSAAGIMTARGINRRAVIILGANEGQMPVQVIEDPVLKDKPRKILRDVLGYWISEKLDRHAEEKLFYYFALGMGTEKVFLTYRRGGRGGAEEVPSLYLLETARVLGLNLEKDAVFISGRETEKYASFAPAFLNKKEMSLRAFLSLDPAKAVKEMALPEAELKDNLKLCVALSLKSGLTPYDGFIGAEAGVKEFARVNSKSGFSASSLHKLASCPMQYFMAKIIGVEEEKDTFKRDGIPANIKGSLYHETLKAVYENLKGKPLTAAALADSFEAACRDNLFEEKYKDYGMYPVMWNVLRKKMKDFLAVFLERDLENMGPYMPSYFEQKAEKTPYDLGGENITLHGIIDRVDVSSETYRIIDYKTTKRGNKDIKEKDVLQGKFLQPAVYFLLSFALAVLDGKEPDSFYFFNIEAKTGGAFKQEMDVSSFKEMENAFKKFLSLLTKIIKEGCFFVFPGDACKYCSYINLCRKEDKNTLMRARSAALYKELQEYEP